MPYMKIDKDLIERYHRQECSPEECEAVESWLFSADSEEALQLPLNESKAAHKAEIWTAIAATLPAGNQSKKVFTPSFWSGAIAASIILATLTFGAYYFMGGTQDQEYDDQVVSINNSSSISVRHVESNGYAISVGTNTSAHIDNLSGTVDLSGSMLIRPKKDIELKFKGNPDKTILKKGQTYIILKGKDGNDKIIVLSEKNIINLPPVLQKQIINEFDI